MSEKEKNFPNPDNLPLEKVIISVKNEGLVREFKALDPHWAETHQMTLYEPPPSGTASILGALDAWVNRMETCKEDLKSLLRLEYHRFWSTILYNSSTLDLLVSFLQEAHPPYFPPYENPVVRALYQEIRRLVLVVFCRLVTNKESKACHMSKEYMKDIIYDHFIFTIPIIWDICLVYGEDNAHTVARMLDCVFTLQPNYLVDLDLAIAFVKEAFKYLILQVNKTYESEEPPNLPETFKGFTNFSKTAATTQNNDKLTLNMLRDLVIHLLDTAMTLRIFLQVYPKGVDIFKKRGLVLSIVQVYEYAIPCLYEQLEEFKDNTSTLQDHIDCARAQLIDIFREMLAHYSNLIFSGGASIESNVEEYLALMMEGLSERLFIRDYHGCYPVHEELEVLRQAYPGLDPLKTDFILQAIFTNIEDTAPEITQPAPPIQNGHSETINNPGPSTSIPTIDTEIPQNIREESLISEVKDILPHLGDGFVLKCLQHYGFSSERVINCILEDNLDVTLRDLDRNMPIIPEDPMDVKFLETGIDRLNVFDGDQFDIMHRNDVDVSKIHKGKKKSKYKDLKDMLNDKTEVRQMGDIYSKYNLVCDVEDYSDEYDDTFDAEGGAPPRGEPGPDDFGRPFVTPRVLQKHAVEEESEEEPEPAQAPTTSNDRSRLDFCQNPEEIRARREAAWRLKNNKGQRPAPPRNTDVVGKARGQGQEKEVLHNREKKEKNKSSRANHNRRSGAQFKRNQGMMPS